MTIGAKQEAYRKLYDAEVDQAIYTTTLDEQRSAGSIRRRWMSSTAQAIYTTTLVGEQRSAGSLRRHWVSSEAQEVYDDAEWAAKRRKYDDARWAAKRRKYDDAG